MKRLSDFLRENRACKTIAEQAFGAFLPEDKNILPIYYSVGDQYRVFAYYGKPAQANPKRGYPAVLLIHGGDGCAYYEWVKEWTEKGFVAIAPDFSAQYAVGEKERHEQNPLGGPAGYGSVNDFGSETPWLYFGVLSAFSALDVLCSDASVDRERLFVQGISWGGFLYLAYAAFDSRIRALSVIYSSAFISDSAWGENRGLKALSAEELNDYNAHIDPQSYLSGIRIPVFFSAGTDDGAFTVRNRKRTSDRVAGEKAFSYRLSFPHGHVSGWSQPESGYFFHAAGEGRAVSPLVLLKEDGSVSWDGAGYEDVFFVFTEEDPMEKDICSWRQTAAARGVRFPLGEIKACFFTGLIEGKYRFSSDVYFVG